MGGEGWYGVRKNFTNFTKGPSLTQPPPLPEGMKMLFIPDTEPLWAMKAPSPPILVALPSKTGELEKLEPSNQFQYYGQTIQLP